MRHAFDFRLNNLLGGFVQSLILCYLDIEVLVIEGWEIGTPQGIPPSWGMGTGNSRLFFLVLVFPFLHVLSKQARDN